MDILCPWSVLNSLLHQFCKLNEASMSSFTKDESLCLHYYNENVFDLDDYKVNK